MNRKGRSMATTFRVNGRAIEIPDGKSVYIINDQVIVDGLAYEEHRKEDGPVMRVEVKGDLSGGLFCDRSVTVAGSVKGSVQASGSVTCGSVEGGVKAGGSVKCGDVGTTVDAGGSVQCGKVDGNVRCGGSIQAGTIMGNVKRKG